MSSSSEPWQKKLNAFITRQPNRISNSHRCFSLPVRPDETVLLWKNRRTPGFLDLTRYNPPATFRALVHGEIMPDKNPADHRRFCPMKAVFLTLTLATILGFSVEVTLAVDLVSVAKPSADQLRNGNGMSADARMSRDGRFVVFLSSATDLTSLAPAPRSIGSFVQVYVRELATEKITLESVSMDGQTAGQGDSYAAMISENGRFVLFESRAPDLAPDDRNGAADIFLRDRSSGVTLRLSSTPTGASGSGFSTSALMTPDARYVVFESSATNLISTGTPAGPQIFFYDVGAKSIRWISAGVPAAAGEALAAIHSAPDLSDDGNWVAFETFLPAITGNTNTPRTDIHLWGRNSGEIRVASKGAAEMTRGPLAGSRANAWSPRVSPDGTAIVFKRELFGTSEMALFRYHIADATLHLISRRTQALDVWGGPQGEPLFLPGGEVLFLSGDSPSVAGRYNTRQAYIWSPLTQTNRMLTIASQGGFPFSQPVHWISASADGTIFAALTDSTNLAVPNPSAFPRLVTASALGFEFGSPDLQLEVREPSSLWMGVPELDPGGQNVLFESSHPRFTGEPSRRKNQVAMIRRSSSEISIVSGPVKGNFSLPVSGNGASYLGSSQVISTNGRFVVFESQAGDLVDGDTNGVSDIYMRDLVLGRTTWISGKVGGTSPTAAASYSPVVSADGNHVAWIGGGNVPGLSLCNLTLDVTITIPPQDGEPPLRGTLAVSSTGKHVAWATRRALYLLDSDTRAVSRISFPLIGFIPDPDFPPVFVESTSALLVRARSNPGGVYSVNLNTPLDSPTRINTLISVFDSPLGDLIPGPRLVMAAGPPNAGIWVQELQGGEPQRISLELPGLPSNPTASFRSPRFSGDGRYVVYESTAPNLATEDKNGVVDVFLSDLVAGTNMLISVNHSGTGSGNGPSRFPWINRDGSFVIFRSEATDLIPGRLQGRHHYYRRDLRDGKTTVLDMPGQPGRTLGEPRISMDGSLLAFDSLDAMAGITDRNDQRDVFVFRLGGDRRFELRGSRLSSGKIGLQWSSLPGRFYQVEFASQIDSASWNAYTEQPLSASGESMNIEIEPNSDSRFFRVKLLP